MRWWWLWLGIALLGLCLGNILIEQRQAVLLGYAITLASAGICGWWWRKE
jgi:hypothetical protein